MVEFMRNILVIGCPGTGKSTFARELAFRTGLPFYYLDMIWHNADRTTVTREEFDRRLAEIMGGDEWIIDGNYKRTLAIRLQKADTVFFLDYPVDVCLTGAIERLGKPRPDMPWKDDLELSDEFRQWILDYPKDQLPIVRQLLKSFIGTLHTFHSRSEATEYLATL